jgi:hypothetical protein
MKWDWIDSSDLSTGWWDCVTEAGTFSVEDCDWLGGWNLHLFVGSANGVAIGPPAKSAETCKRRAEKYLRDLSAKLAARADA